MIFAAAVQIVFSHEGGYVNDPADPGGETRWGISKRAYGDLDIASLSKEDAEQIYRIDYWDACRCDDLPNLLRLAVFDFAVNAGVRRSVRTLQSALNDCGATLTVDGFIGTKTISATVACNRGEVLDCFSTRRTLFYSRLPTFRRFGRGWMRRTFNVHRLSE